MKKILHRSLVSVVFAFHSIVFEGCTKNPVSPQPPPKETGAWAIYTPFDWAHDGRPHESTYCTIYSDAAEDAMKQHMGEIADEHFFKIMRLFDFQDPSDFIHPPGYVKIEIYLNTNHEENIAWAYWGGLIITIRSSEISEQWIDYTVYTVRHELTHVFEFLIEGREELGTDVWFREGLAACVGCMESGVFQTMDSRMELESWITENQNTTGNGNPIRIHRHSDIPYGTAIHDFYRIFELAVRYLIDENGLGKSPEDVLASLYDLRSGMPFAASFQERFGITLETYETEFFERMRFYLGGTLRASPPGSTPERPSFRLQQARLPQPAHQAQRGFATVHRVHMQTRNTRLEQF